MSNSTKSFMDLWLELYDSEWKGYSEMQSIIEVILLVCILFFYHLFSTFLYRFLQQKMLLWEDLLRKIQNDLMEPLQLYMSKFPETKVELEGERGEGERGEGEERGRGKGQRDKV